MSSSIFSRCHDQFERLYSLETLKINKCKSLTEQDILRLGSLSTLKSLTFSGRINKKIIMNLNNLRNIEELHIEEYSSKNFKYIRELINLKKLTLYDCNIFYGFEDLKSLINLEELLLPRCYVTTQNIDSLKEFTNLKRIYVSRHNVWIDQLQNIERTLNLKRTELNLSEINILLH